MDAEAHLRSLGWAGPGSGLRTGSLQRAILTSKKTDLKGLGAKVDESDQWWDNVFSKQLSNIAVGLDGEIAQINGGVSAAHPVAARNAHRRQFGEKSALEKVFIMGEVLKGNESFIPLPQKTTSKKERPHLGKGRSASILHSDALALPSPPPSPRRQGTTSDTAKQQLSHLSDKALRKEARRIRKEARKLDRAAKAARKERRRLKRLKREAKALETKDFCMSKSIYFNVH